MYKLSLENEYGDKIELTNNPNYDVTVTGLNPVKSDVITSPVANYNGGRYVSSRQQVRNVVITVFIKEPVETNRINLYKYVKSKKWIRVYYSNKTRDIYVDGYVESFECDFFTQKQTAQISIICPNPQLMDVNADITQVSSTLGAFSFPFYSTDSELIAMSVYGRTSALVINESDDDIGFIYKIKCNGEVVAPMIYVEDTGAYFKLNGTYHKESIITINTLNGQKSVSCEWRGNVKNIINDLDATSTWLRLQTGYNHILQTADSGIDNMVSELIYNKEYEGV